jgi:putative Mn2+ efflux pump MntP
MTFPALVFVALGVSADAFAVSLTQGVRMRTRAIRNALIIASSFALFQVAMPLIGWAIGTAFAGYISAVDHWIAFALLALIGGKMIWEAVTAHEDSDSAAGRLNWRELIVLSFATSVDALAVGISFAFLEVDIWSAISLIGVFTLAASLAAIWIGRRVGRRFRRPAELAGGIILIAIGTQVLVEHLTA